MKPWTRQERVGLAIAAVLLLLPMFCRAPGQWGLPRVWAGDPPHYLVMLHSLIQDADLELSNNYAAAHRGSLDGGGRFASDARLDHHVAYWKGDHRIPWCDAYECDAARWDRDADGHPVPRRRADFGEELTGLAERPMHPAGLPLFLAAFTWPFARTPFVEPLAILLNGLAVVLAMLVFHALARSFVTEPRRALAVTLVTFLGTPIWHYARALFAEGFLVLLVVVAFQAVLRRRDGWFAGACVAVGTLMKPPFLLFGLALAVPFVRERRWRGLAALSGAGALAVAASLAMNQQLHGSPWRPAQPFQWLSPLEGVPYQLLDLKHGLLPFSPLLLVAALGWPRLGRTFPADALPLLLGAGLYFGLMGCWGVASGGWCYGARLTLPVVPLLMLGLCGVDPTRRGVRAVAGALTVLAVAVNAAGAFFVWDVYDQHPLRLLFRG